LTFALNAHRGWSSWSQCAAQQCAALVLWLPSRDPATVSCAPKFEIKLAWTLSDMSRYPAGKFRLWVGQPVNAPFVTPPISLRGFLIVCILSVTGTLLYAVDTQLRMGTSTPGGKEIFVSLLYFILPVLIAHSIAVNRSISRPLIVLYTSAIAFQIFRWLEGRPESFQYRTECIASVSIGFLMILWWLFGNIKMRVYYALISGRDLPDDLPLPADELLAPGRFERSFRRIARKVAPHTEKAIVILILAAVLLGWASMTVRW